MDTVSTYRVTILNYRTRKLEQRVVRALSFRAAFALCEDSDREAIGARLIEAA